MTSKPLRDVTIMIRISKTHDDVIKWKHFPRCWPFVRGIHRTLVNSPHKCQWRGSLMFSLTLPCTKNWVNNRDAGNLGRHRARYEVIVMEFRFWIRGVVLSALSESLSARDALRHVSDSYWAWKLREFPKFATDQGIHAYDETVEEFTLEAFERRKVGMGTGFHECICV